MPRRSSGVLLVRGRIFGTRVFQAGMGFVANAEIAATVSNAGGLGCLSWGSRSARELTKHIRLCREIADRLLAVDILLPKLNPIRRKPNVFPDRWLPPER